MNNIQTIYNTLPVNAKVEVEDFIQFLATKHKSHSVSVKDRQEIINNLFSRKLPDNFTPMDREEIYGER